MCILFIAIQQHPDYPLIIAANRDEFFQRPTRPSQYWDDAPRLLAGKDLQAGGTWLGVNKHGYVAGLTNIRAPQRVQIDAHSRGALVRNYLLHSPSQAAYHDTLVQQRGQYNGYNLLFGHWQQLAVYNNHLNRLTPLHEGVYGLSNAHLNSAWPKVNKGTHALKQYCHAQQTIEVDTLFDLLQDRTQAADADLPQTGVSLAWERQLSAIFIEGTDYGTRCSTIFLIDAQQRMYWHERSYNQRAVCVDTRSFQWQLAV